MAEMVIFLAILAVIMIAVYSFEANVFIYTNQSGVQITNTWQAEALLKPMTKELRGMVPSATGSYPIASVATSSIAFFVDVNNDGSIEEVRYFLSNGNLYRGVTVPSGSPLSYNLNNETKKVLANGVVSSSTLPLFRYFDGTYEGTSTPLVYPINISSIRYMDINVIIDSDPNRSPVPRTFTSGVSLRNLKNNL